MTEVGRMLETTANITTTSALPPFQGWLFRKALHLTRNFTNPVSPHPFHSKVSVSRHYRCPRLLTCSIAGSRSLHHWRANSGVLADPIPPHSTSHLAHLQDADIWRKGPWVPALVLRAIRLVESSWLLSNMFTACLWFQDEPFSHFTISETVMCFTIDDDS